MSQRLTHRWAATSPDSHSRSTAIIETRSPLPPTATNSRESSRAREKNRNDDGPGTIGPIPPITLKDSFGATGFAVAAPQERVIPASARVAVHDPYPAPRNSI